MKRVLCILAALFLALTAVFSALAEGRLLTLWNAGSRLLFETDNVSLTGHATFTYDGEQFKVFDGRYVQEGTDSYMQVMLDTPKEDGSIYTGGYTVFGEGGTVYSIETNRPKIYQTNTTLIEPSILTNTVMRSSLLRFGGLLLDLVEGSMQNAVTQEKAENGEVYRIALSAGETPEIVNAALTLMMQLAAKEYLYIDLDNDYVRQGAWGTTADLAFTEDYEALFAAEYEKNFHEPLPEDFYSSLWNGNGKATAMQARYEMINDLINLRVEEAEAAYDHGLALVLADGTVRHYETYDEYLIAYGYEDLRYENYGSAFRAWYEKKTGTPLSADELRTVYLSTNSALADRYIEMTMEMEAEHLSAVRAGGYSCAMVRSDGTLQGYNNTEVLNYLSMLEDMTVTRRIFTMMDEISVKSADVTALLDAEGRLTEVTGTAEFAIVDVMDEEHTLTVDFTGLAFDYGTSHAEEFDPEKLQVISAKEYYSGGSVNDYSMPLTTEEPVQLPEVIVFDGVEYTVDTGDVNG